ncbi:hypothetical protein EYZ11_003787 [Aspergillus tanneri]|uniref:DUF7703 domain-containing protein n=1 Tax=Aspergillus tanneri TaxID=1220188 RepID=A0A4S3JM67_9EURO|nr:hypothetical protein EYZ11_003787 [Aspergillus tanneri]
MTGSLSDPPSGLIGGYQDGSFAIQILIVVFSSIAMYNAIELVVMICVTFKHHRSLYFWALLLSLVLGVLPHSVGYLLEFFAKGPIWLAVAVSTVGFYFMVPGQSVVLYSRLHLVVPNRKFLRSIAYLITINAIVLTIPTTVLTYATIYVRKGTVITGYNIMERLQLSWFCAQEILLSGIYIYETARILQTWPGKDPKRIRTLYNLITVNIAIICLDVALLSLEYLNFYILQTTLKPTVYSIKLKLEFGILRKLVTLVKPGRNESNICSPRKIPSCVDSSKIAGDNTHAVTIPNPNWAKTEA